MARATGDRWLANATQQPQVERYSSCDVPESECGRSGSGSWAIFAARGGYAHAMT